MQVNSYLFEICRIINKVNKSFSCGIFDTKMCENIFQKILDGILESNSQDMNEVHSYLEGMFHYNMNTRKGKCLKVVLHSFKRLSNNDDNEETMKLLHVVGLCIEIMEESFNIHDDIMDNALIRRNNKCWYLETQAKGYGLISINDGLFLSAIIPKILKHYFQWTPFYINLLELFNEALFRTSVGQCFDMLTSSDTINWQRFNENRFETIAKWKTFYISFCLPVFSAMILAGKSDKSLFEKLEPILLEMGKYLQIQDDFLDCYGDTELMGKECRDIEEGKCSWLVVQALKLVNESQLVLLKENYGKNDENSVKLVKDLYEQLNLKTIYEEYKIDVEKRIKQAVNELKDTDGHVACEELFLDLLNFISDNEK